MNSFLTPRLFAISDLVTPGAAVIDVGTDHAYVPIYLVKEKGAVCALATDVHDGPIRRAEENIQKFGLTDKIKTQKANGLQGVDYTKYDTIIIAGMGGILISDILENTKSLEEKTLLLQPMTATMELRKYLNEHGFSVLTERIVQEEEKLYVVLKAVCGMEPPYSDAELLLGRKSRNEPLYPLLKSRIKEKIEKKLAGKLRAKKQNEEEIKKLEHIVQELSV